MEVIMNSYKKFTLLAFGLTLTLENAIIGMNQNVANEDEIEALQTIVSTGSIPEQEESVEQPAAKRQRLEPAETSPMTFDQQQISVGLDNSTLAPMRLTFPNTIANALAIKNLQTLMQTCVEMKTMLTPALQQRKFGTLVPVMSQMHDLLLPFMTGEEIGALASTSSAMQNYIMFGNFNFMRMQKLLTMFIARNKYHYRTETTLHRIISNRRLSEQKMIDLITILLRHGSNVNAKKINNVTPLIACAYHHDYPRVIKLLLDHNATIETQESSWGNTALHSAAWSNHIETVKVLLAHGANKNKLNKYSETPYSLAKNPLARMIKNYKLNQNISQDNENTLGDLFKTSCSIQ